MKSHPLSFLLIVAALVGCGGTADLSQVASLAESLNAESSSAESSNAATNEQSEDAGSLQASSASPRYVVRKAVAEPSGPTIPRVLLSAGHAKLCAVQVGDAFPAISLPKLGGGPTELASLYGSQATVVLFWHPDRWMARTALTDMQRDIVAQFTAQQVSVVGIAVRQPRGAVQAALNQATASFPQLIDTAGTAFAAVGTLALPRLYVLDPQGQIVWFDIEYSEGTRRELWQTLRTLSNK